MRPRDVDEELPVIAEGTGTAHAGVLAELHDLRRRLGNVEGSLVATTDGLVIAHDLGASETYGVEPSGVAALAAVSLGLSQRIADTASHGDLRETVVRGSLGQVVTYAAGERALLTILLRDSGELRDLHSEARPVADRIAALLADVWQDDAATWHSHA
jgi:predicted regulator of Ras-like GTPase activity (Roadblock/LC7/MglB family)